MRLNSDPRTSTLPNLSSKARLGGVLMLGAVLLTGCSSIRETRGFIVDPLLASSVQPGLDNRRSVEGTLGRPTFTSQYGDPVWYYVSSTTGRRPFVRPKVATHTVLAVKFDGAGNVISADRTGIDEVVFLQPEGDTTPTLGRERTFLEDLFGNIGAVGAGAPGGGAAGP
jgi:outer membrane protein assembly factor BamE (lipoprotein component of BamABCDE complex)